MFQLVVEKANEGIEPFDSMVSKTIENIVEKFFENESNSLIFICSEYDKKERIRNDVFNRWYNQSVNKERILKIDNIMEIINGNEKHKFYTSFLIHKDHPEYKRLIGIFNQIEKVLNEK